MNKERYDEKFTTKFILKYRGVDQSDDPSSVYYVPEIDLIEDIASVGFTLDTVQSWQQYNDPLKKFINKSPKTVVNIYSGDSYIILESFDYFDLIMEEFLQKQQNNGQPNSESTETI